ncbi:hypothetical protein E2320_009440, partial [Naja naja]
MGPLPRPRLLRQPSGLPPFPPGSRGARRGATAAAAAAATSSLLLLSSACD